MQCFKRYWKLSVDVFSANTLTFMKRKISNLILKIWYFSQKREGSDATATKIERSNQDINMDGDCICVLPMLYHHCWYFWNHLWGVFFQLRSSKHSHPQSDIHGTLYASTKLFCEFYLLHSSHQGFPKTVCPGIL